MRVDNGLQLVSHSSSEESNDLNAPNQDDKSMSETHRSDYMSVFNQLNALSDSEDVLKTAEKRKNPA